MPPKVSKTPKVMVQKVEVSTELIRNEIAKKNTASRVTSSIPEYPTLLLRHYK